MKLILMLAILALASCTAATTPVTVGQPAPPPVAATGVVAQAGKLILSGERAFAAAADKARPAVELFGIADCLDAITGKK